MVVPAGTPVPVTVMPAAGAPEMDVSVDVEFPVSLDEDTVAVFVAPLGSAFTVLALKAMTAPLAIV